MSAYTLAEVERIKELEAENRNLKEKLHVLDRFCSEIFSQCYECQQYILPGQERSYSCESCEEVFHPGCNNPVTICSIHLNNKERNCKHRFTCPHCPSDTVHFACRCKNHPEDYQLYCLDHQPLTPNSSRQGMCCEPIDMFMCQQCFNAS